MAKSKRTEKRKLGKRCCDQCDEPDKSIKYRGEPHFRFLCDPCKTGQDKILADGILTPFQEFSSDRRTTKTGQAYDEGKLEGKRD